MTTTSAEPPLKIALAIGRALAAERLDFVHWKSNSHLAEALAGQTDIDMYADPVKAPEVRACLRAQGCLEMVSQPWGRYPDVEDWLAFDEDTGRFLHIHLHFALVTGLRRIKHLRLPWGVQMLHNRDHALDPVWPTPTSEMELMVLLVRMWAKMPPAKRKGRLSLPPHVRREFDWLCQRTEPALLRRIAGELLPGFDSTALVALLGSPPPSDEAVLAVSRSIYDTLGDHHRMGWTAARLRGTLLNARASLAKELRKLRASTVTGKRAAGQGLVVAVIGSDGSGKSTLTAELRKWLRYKLDVHGYYLGTGEGSTRLTDRLRRAVKGRGKAKKKKQAQARAAGEAPRRPRGFLERLAALHQLPSVRAKRLDLLAARRLAEGGSMVVLDRFPQSEVNGIYDGPRLQDGNSFAWAARLEQKGYAALAGLKPDLLIKLVVSPAVAHARKPDHGLAAIERKCAITASLRFPGTHVVTIDADQPLDQVMLEAKRTIWRHMLRKANVAR